MTEKNEKPARQPGKEDQFTGSPEQQLPDLEAEDMPIPEDQQDGSETDKDTDKEQ